MRTRAAALSLFALMLVASCTPEKRYEYREPAYYGLDMVFCHQEVAPTESCDEIDSGSVAIAFVNVIAGKVGGRVIQVEVNGPVLGTVKGEELYVPRGESYSQWVEISRDVSCRELPCTISITAYVDYEPILTESITFT